MVPSHLDSTPFEAQISCGPAHPPYDTSTAAQSLPVPPASHQNLPQEGMGCVCPTRDPHRN